jgi:starch-binding outer membrane protein, SusD/RagB family
MKLTYNTTYVRYFFKNIFILAGIIMLFLSSCKKFVEADPPTNKITSSNVFSNNVSAVAAMTSIYINMTANSKMSTGRTSIGLMTGLESDELKNYNNNDATYVQFYTNSITNQSGQAQAFWKELYAQIHVVNVVLEGLEKSTGVSLSIKKQLTGEAKFMRAFFHFYAVNLFGKAPLVTTTDYRVNNIITRSEISQVYQQVIQDLKDAQANLSDDILDGMGNPSGLRVRINKAAATAMLARVYLYRERWSEAETESAKLINNPKYVLGNNLNELFLGTSQEAIWQLQPTVAGFNTYDGYTYILTSTPGSGAFPVALNPLILNAFEAGDARLSNWVGKFTSGGNDYYYPYKYKIGPRVIGSTPTEYIMVLRLSEQYLISAEAKIRQENIAEGIADLNILRRRARMPATTITPDPLPDLSINLSKSDAIKAVLHERQVELFSEWGHRWFDLKRTDSLNSTMQEVAFSKNITWNPYQALLPIPESEIQLNPNLTQNDGYK